MKKNERYLVKKTIPLNPPLKAGDVVDASHPFYKTLDFKDSNFFEIYSEPMYYVGQTLIYNNKLCVVNLVVNSKLYEVKNVNDGYKYRITDKTKTTSPTFFWFLNSDGKLIEDYEERETMNRTGLSFKKRVGNYHLTKEDAEKYRDYLLKNKK